jgi:hypothetical protein
LYSQILSKNIRIIPYKTINLPLDLNGCEIWFLALKQVGLHRLRVLENGELKIFRPKTEVIGGWRSA